MNEITLYKTDPTKNLFRFYHLDIQADLFGNQCLIRQWGRIGKAGQIKTIPFPSLKAAKHELAKYQQLKIRRGYSFTN